MWRPIFLLSKRPIKSPQRLDHQQKNDTRAIFGKLSSLSCVFFNLAKPLLTPRVFFTWLIRCTFPNWWAKGTQAWNRTTVSPAPDVVKKNCLKFPFLSHISIVFATYIKAVSKKRYISLKVKSHIQMRIFAIIHVK